MFWLICFIPFIRSSIVQYEKIVWLITGFLIIRRWIYIEFNRNRFVWQHSVKKKICTIYRCSNAVDMLLQPLNYNRTICCFNCFNINHCFKCAVHLWFHKCANSPAKFRQKCYIIAKFVNLVCKGAVKLESARDT